MFGLIEDKEKIQQSLKVLSDPEIMLSRSGIRSLSKGDQFYLYKSNYWRGAVWINVNFLTLRGLYQNYLGIDGIQKETLISQIGTNKDSLSIERNSLTEQIDTGK